jgi:uncharacterized protein
MSVEVATSVACNLHCEYCYQEGMRDAGNASEGQYDLDAIKRGIVAEEHVSRRPDQSTPKDRLPKGFTVFGGEPLLMAIEDLAELWRWGFERYGRNSMQTNATLMTPEHLALIKQYRVSVGVSVDGPDELNDSRWAGTVEKTREATAKSQAAIEALCAQGTPPSLIVTIYRGNAGERLPRLMAWLDGLHGRGVKHVNVHVLEVDSEHVRREMALPSDELLAAMRTLRSFAERRPGLRVLPFDDMRLLLLAQDETVTRDKGGRVRKREGKVSCIWGACDSYTTKSVRGIDANGGRSNCGRTNKEGVSWHKGETVGHERQLALYQTPQEHGGCQGCRFFLACKGNCPGTAIGGDWRNRSEHCAVWFGLLEDTEQAIARRGAMPISLSPFRQELEAAVLEVWAGGGETSMRAAVDWLGRPAAERRPLRQLVSSTHGDVPHGDHHDAAPSKVN